MEAINKFYTPLYLVMATLVLLYGSYTDLQQSNDYLRIGLSLVSSVAGAITVLLVAKEKISNYFFGIISVSIWFVVVVVWSPLIWDAVINIIYLILNFYGLYYWLNPSKQQQNLHGNVAKSRNLNPTEYFKYTAIAIVAIAFMSYIGITIGRYETPKLAMLDALTTAVAILAQYLMAKKIVQNWHLWILLNAISIPLYISIGNYTFVALWVVYLVNSVYGLYMWKHKMQSYN